MGGSNRRGLDNKLLLRSDGTAVYMTQDIDAVLRHKNMVSISVYM